MKAERAKELIRQSGGICSAASFVQEGFTHYDVARLCKQGEIDRIKHGYYRLTDQAPIYDEQLLASLLPEGIICVESALFHYGYSDFVPRKWSIAVPRTFSRSKLQIAGLEKQVYFVSPDLFPMGKTSEGFNGVQLLVYDRERTICDCFKYRTKIDREMFLRALKTYAKDPRKDLRRLSDYAQKMRVLKSMQSIMEILLND